MALLPSAQEEIVSTLLGTCRTATDLAAEYGVEEDEIERLAAQNGIERCVTCDWWCESHEIESEECEDCRDE